MKSFIELLEQNYHIYNLTKILPKSQSKFRIVVGINAELETAATTGSSTPNSIFSLKVYKQYKCVH